LEIPSSKSVFLALVFDRGNKGFILDSYYAAFYRENQIEKALSQLEKMPDKNEAL
jgi:hypothetical protein